MKKYKYFTALLVLTMLTGCAAQNGPAAEQEADQSVQAASEPAETQGFEFTAQTMTGNVFTQDDLAEYELTMVNIWQTTCGYCIEEIPDLDYVHGNLPDGTNMISICLDANYSFETAEKILGEYDTGYETLIYNDELYPMLKGVQGTPTTLFVDGSGNIVGDAIVGSPRVNEGTIADVYLKQIDAHLDLLRNG